MAKKYSNRSSRFGTRQKTQPGEELKNNSPKDATKPERSYEVNPSFQRRAFRDLSFQSFTMKVDPDSEAAYQADPYAVLNGVNPVVDAVYPGNDNTSGSIVPQLANGSTSTFAQAPDCIRMIVKINYAFCYLHPNSNADHYTNSSSQVRGRVNQKMMIPYQEILNTISAEAFYDLPFFKWTAKNGFTDDSKLDVLLNYQAIIQSVTSIPLRYRVIRSLEKHLKDMCYMNGALTLNSLYGLLKKAAFINAIKGVSESIMYHYLDRYWFQQIAMLVAIPCRKANDMTNPLIDIIPEYDINDDAPSGTNSLKVYATSDQTQPAIIDFHNYTNLMKAIADILDKMSPQYLLSLARNPATSGTDIRNWFNTLVSDCDTVVSEMNKFTKDFADLLVAFKRMAKVGITEWSIGEYVSIDKLEEAYQPKFNKLIYDILRSCFTGSRDITYDTTINKWSHLDLWDKYLGINSYDYKSGGCILTFSSKKAVRSGAPNTVIYPALFYGTAVSGTNGATVNQAPQATVLTRNNNLYYINTSESRIDTGSVGRSIGRLVPISSQDTTYFRTPYIDISSLSSSPKFQGWLQNMMIELFGYSDALVASSTHNYMASQDAFCFVDVEVDDQSNAIETFVRQHSPFRVIKTTLDNKLGFITKK